MKRRMKRAKKRCEVCKIVFLACSVNVHSIRYCKNCRKAMTKLNRHFQRKRAWAKYHR